MKTQKARGIAALAEYGLNWRVPRFKHVATDAELDLVAPGSWFARPCPVRPRHGFVDSRVCTDLNQIRDVWAAARAADPEAELILMRPIEAVCSGVLAGDRLAIGPGHDGATAGHGAHELTVLPVEWSADLLTAAGLAPATETAYVELVHSAEPFTYAVQLRAGPALPAGADYIPADVTVTAVVTPHDDLLRWERDVACFGPGTVVAAPGGSLASHAAIHCVIHGVPYVTSRPVAVGDQLSAVVTGAPAFTLNAAAFLTGGAIADRMLQTCASEVCQLAVLVLHQWPALRASGAAASRMLGFACRALARAGAAICAGEARHYSLRLRRQRQARMRRSTRIAKSLAATPTVQRRQLTLAAKAFAADGWRSSFGGPAWVACASAVDRLWRAQASESPNEAALVSAMNTLVNVCHNGGALLTKLVSTDYLNIAAREPTRLLTRQLGDLYQILVATDAPAKRLPPGARVARPKSPRYTHMIVRVEAGGLKAHLWSAGVQYVSHHLAAPEDVRAWVEAQPHTATSRHPNSSQQYVPIQLSDTIKANSEAVLAAVRAAMAVSS